MIDWNAEVKEYTKKLLDKYSKKGGSLVFCTEIDCDFNRCENQQQMEAMVMMCELHYNHRLKQNTIASMLNSKGYKSSHGMKFSGCIVRTLLMNFSDVMGSYKDRL